MFKTKGLVPFLGAIIAFGGVTLLFGFSGSLNPIDALLGRGRLIEVPDLAGRALPSAKAEAKSVGLVPKVRRAYSLSVPRGSVIRTQPAAGESARSGDEIELTVSNGENKVEMPDAVGKALSAVRGPLDDASIKVTVTRVPSETIEEGVVISQEPDPGVAISGDQSAKFVVSSGPERRAVPQTSGMTVQGAAFALGEAGLKLGSVTLRDSDEVPLGAVVSTLPTSGTMVEKDTAVSIEVSAGSPPVAVPDVVGSTASEARSKLSGIGFGVQAAARILASGESGIGSVLEQRPAAGTQLRPGEVVTIVIGESPPPPPTTSTTTTTTTTTTVSTRNSPNGTAGPRPGAAGD